MANRPAHWHKKVVKQVHSILLDYPHSIAIFRKKAEAFCAEYQMYLDTREQVDPAEITVEERANPHTIPDIDETALKTIPRDPIRGSEYYREPATKREELSEQYTALAVLHDSVLRGKLQSSVIILTDKSWACPMIQPSILGNKTDYDEKFYQDALEAVKADLARKQEKAGQGNPIRGGGKARDTTEPPRKAGQGDNWHNDDYTEVRWNGKRYTFNKTQARVVEYLWSNKRASEKSIGEHIESENDHYRLRHTFREKKGSKSKMHRAWGTMIVKAGKGIYALNEQQHKSPKK